jgi:two-component system, NtrC family, sensor kinase
MKPLLKISILLFLPFFAKAQYPAIAQSKMTEQVNHQTDSIFNLLSKETDENKKVKLYLSFYALAIDGNPLQPQRIGQKMLGLARKNNDLIMESGANSFAGQGNRLTGNYVKALEFHQKAVSLAEQTGNKLLQGIAITQMAHIYKDRLENERALTLYKQSLQKLEEGDKNFNWWALMNIGAVYYTMGNYDSSLYYSRDALKRININNSAGPGTISVAYSTIAKVYSQKNKPDSVAKYFELALNFTKEAQSPRYFNVTYVAIAEHFNWKQQYDSSAFYYKKAVNVVSGTEMSYLVLKPAKKLTDYYQNINADSTVKYWKVYSAANDSINSVRTNQQIQQLTFEEDQRKRDIEAAQEAYRNKISTGLLLVGLALFSIIAFILYRNNRQKQKANKVLGDTLTNLKSTQSQLIQSEKMASLGELTAGIAHEIQNPLNFVNNFSEVNKELLAEMKVEIDKGNIADAKEIAKDVIANEEKINHHGKRADAIVKGMLQHSSSGSGKKEPTDINLLADEYLRLAYHGLRAKDKSFNATMKTDFDESIGSINIIPQDIGRVILNLITNAFYVVNEKSNLNIAGFEPTVSVSTKKEGNKVLISVKDNGNGIPQKILDKIFQPFFTTKPTGQGTGLGLSLSYDIVKAHGGELKVETKEGEWSEFVVSLPIV